MVVEEGAASAQFSPKYKIASYFWEVQVCCYGKTEEGGRLTRTEFDVNVPALLYDSELAFLSSCDVVSWCQN